jgi:uncharacterized protein
LRIEGEHEFTATRRQVWDALQDPRILGAAVPGARRLEPTGPDEYAIAVDVGVGSVRGTYEGTFAIADKQPLESCTVSARAGGRPGSVSATARMRLRDGGDGSGAVLSYEADATLTGPLAGVGQRLVGAAARRTTEQFLAALDRTIAAPPPLEEEPAAAAPEPSRALEPAAPRRGARRRRGRAAGRRGRPLDRAPVKGSPRPDRI